MYSCNNSRYETEHLNTKRYTELESIGKDTSGETKVEVDRQIQREFKTFRNKRF